MVLTIKLKDKKQLEKLNKFLKDNSIEVINENDDDSSKMVDDLRKTFSKYKMRLPDNYEFEREEANER